MRAIKPIIKNSDSLYERAMKIIPIGTQTFSKSVSQFVKGVCPKYLKKGKGCRVWDVDGNEFIDYGGACGPIILGYSYESVNKAIVDQLEDGTILTLPHPLEVEVSEILVDMIPCAEMVRFAKNGSDVTTAAVRLARHYTNRDIIADCGYHGWHDWTIGTYGGADKFGGAGIPEAIKSFSKRFKYNDIDSLKKIFDEYKDEVSCVIMEPAAQDEPKNDFLNKVKELTHENGAVLIFDEVVTGFRWGLGGAQEYYNVIPDLACFGKAISNGMPLSALVGKKEIMHMLDTVFFSFTYPGEMLSLAAAKATINEMKEKNVLEFIHKMGKRLCNGVRELITNYGLEDCIRIGGVDFRPILFYKDPEKRIFHKSLLQQELTKRNILMSGSMFITFSHKERDIDETISAFDESLSILSKGVKERNEEEMLEGEPVIPIFERYKF